MKKVKNTLTKEARKMYGRVKATRNKAQWIGMFYLLGTIILAALAVLPTLNIDYVNVMGSMKPLWADIDALGANVSTISRVLYVITLLTVVINVLKSFGKLGWLYKRKASKTYGFNRNAYAMQDMAKNFAKSFAVILINTVLIVAINGAWGDAAWTEIGGLVDALKANSAVYANFDLFGVITLELPTILFVVAAGVVFHLILCCWGGKISMFVAEEGVGVSEEKRTLGRFAPLVRNFFQVVFVIAVSVLFLEISTIDVFVADALAGSVNVDLAVILQLVILLAWMICTVHAVNPTEFNVDGAEGKGMKNYGFFMFVIFGVAAYNWYNSDPNFTFALTNELLLAAVALVACLIELIIKAPRYKDPEEEVAEEEAEVEYDENGNPIVVAEEPVIVETDDIDWRYFFSDEFVGGEISGVIIR